jgi:hypothetical protein
MGEFPMANPPSNRQLIQNDKRLSFDLTNPCYRPVVYQRECDLACHGKPHNPDGD